MYNREADDEIQLVLKGVIRSERLMDPDFYIQAILDKAKVVDIENKYKVKDWVDAEDFLKMLARRMGKLGKGGEPDINTVAKKVVFEWQRGQIPYCYLPEGMTEEDIEGEEADVTAMVEEEINGIIQEEDSEPEPEMA